MSVVISKSFTVCTESPSFILESYAGISPAVDWSIPVPACNLEFSFKSILLLYFFPGFRKVNLFEDSDNNVHLKNLSLHQASNEEEGEKNFYQKNNIIILILFNKIM